MRFALDEACNRLTDAPKIKRDDSLGTLPLMTKLRTTREKLLAIGSGHVNEKRVKAIADTEASLLARLIVANVRMQLKLFKILSPERQKKLCDFERMQGALTSDGK